MNFRVLDLNTNSFVDATWLAISSKGELISIGGQVPEQYIVQQGINFDGITHHELYEGDAISIKATIHKGIGNDLRSILDVLGAQFLPKDFDEVIIQLVTDVNNIPYYWVMFKKDGDYIQNKEVEGLLETSGHDGDEEEPWNLRAIPMGDITQVAKLINNRPFEVVYNCTDQHWLKFM